MERVYWTTLFQEWETENNSMKAEEMVNVNDIGPNILNDKVKEAVSNLKNGKVEGFVGIPTEMIQVLGENSRATITELCRSMYK